MLDNSHIFSPLAQQSLKILASGTGFVKDKFSMDWGGGGGGSGSNASVGSGG